MRSACLRRMPATARLRFSVRRARNRNASNISRPRTSPKKLSGRIHGHHRRRTGHHAGRTRRCRTAEKSFGVNIRLPWEQSANPIIAEDKKLITFKYFFTRKLIFIRHSDAIVLFPGGFGTLDEGYEAITLMQTGKAQLMPLVLVDKPGGTYWKTWDIHVREELLRDKLISPG